MGLLTRDGARLTSVAFNQIVFGFVGGFIMLLITANIPYAFWRKYAFWIFLTSLVATLLVFVPGIGFGHGGARRWIMIAGFTFQTSELLKIGFIVYFSAWCAMVKDKASTFRYGFIPFMILIGIVGAVLLKQPDTDTFMVIFAAGVAMFIVAGARFRYISLLAILGVLAVLVLAFMRPYVWDRINTFINPNLDPHGSSYQSQQSLIAIGSGGLTGRGFGQSVQKFNYLPEPIGDSIFAVAGEEFGFVGGLFLILLFLFFAIRGLKIASSTNDIFGRLVVTGIVILITAQAFVNIGAMLGVLPLSGITLPFVSHGGSSLFITLAQIGIIINISKHKSNRALGLSKK